MWFELLESVSELERIEYIMNYKDIFDDRGFPVIPKEVLNVYI
jgi:hypothetical protein